MGLLTHSRYLGKFLPSALLGRRVAYAGVLGRSGTGSAPIGVIANSVGARSFHLARRILHSQNALPTAALSINRPYFTKSTQPLLWAASSGQSDDEREKDEAIWQEYLESSRQARVIGSAREDGGDQGSDDDNSHIIIEDGDDEDLERTLEVEIDEDGIITDETDSFKDDSSGAEEEVVIDAHGSDASAEGQNQLLSPGSLPLPSRVTVVPLFRRPIFPGIVAPILIQDEDFYSHLEKNINSGDRHVGLFLVRKEFRKGENPDKISGPSQLHEIGVIARIIRLIRGPKPGTHQALISGQSRIEVNNSVPVSRKPLSVSIREVKDKPLEGNDKYTKAVTVEIVSTIKEILKLNPFFKEQLQTFVEQVDLNSPGELADLAAALTTADADQLQEVLEANDVELRLQKALTLLKSELDLSQIQQKIQKQLEDKISKNQRKYFLNEQLKSIKKELGLETDEKEALTVKFRERMKDLNPSKQANEVIEEELNKLTMLEPASSEFNITRNYLDWLTCLPWGKMTKDKLDLREAVKILDQDHYGLKEVKDRILEFIAVGALKGSIEGKILCLVGPPGVGKTSIGKSIARSVGREYYRFSVGGMSDVAEIKGHRRTYVGAMPGKVIQCLKVVKAANPVVVIDEIDKLGRGYQGDPASALLEVLDPEQNNAFLDHYLDVPFDISRFLFVATANQLDTIPKPLLDRMEIIQLSGYILDEKMHIAKKYLVKQARKDTGLSAQQIQLRDSALKELIRNYCREAGVRNLQKHIERIFRKAAFNIVHDGEEKIVVTPDNLVKFVGQAPFSSDRYYERCPAGVVTGLAWTPMGGATLYIETVVESASSGGQLRSTGQMGDVMRESSTIAHTFARRFIQRVEAGNTFFDRNNVHMHVPEGATPKDGPSAGSTMVTSMLSLALNKPVKHNLAMTGEVTLTGKVLAIGGVKEKAIAARRSGVRVMILPEANRKDYEELPDNVKKGLEVHFVEEYEDIFKVAFPGVDLGA